MTEEAKLFRQKPEYRDKLAELLKDPVLQLAIGIIKDGATPKPPNTQEVSTLADVVLGRRYLLMSGTNQGFADLEMLSKPIALGETDESLLAKAYDYKVPPELREQEKPKC